jgi:hypothetical protein
MNKNSRVKAFHSKDKRYRDAVVIEVSVSTDTATNTAKTFYTVKFNDGKHARLPDSKVIEVQERVAR